MRFILSVFLLTSSLVFSQEPDYKKAETYYKRSEKDSAALFIRKAIKKAKISSSGYISKYNLFYSKILKNQVKIDSSFYYIDLAEKDFLKRNVNDSLLLTYTLKAEVFRFINKVGGANEYVKKIDEFFKSDIQNVDIKAYALNRKMAIVNHFHGTSKDSIANCKRIAKQIFELEEGIEDKEIIAYTYNELAQIIEYHENPLWSIKMYENAIAYCEKYNLETPLVDVLINLARVHWRNKNDLDSAVKILEKALSITTRINNLWQSYRIHGTLKEYYFIDKNLEKALYHSDKTYELLSLLIGNENEFKLQEIEGKYNVAEKENELQEKENEINIKNIELKNTRNRFWLILVFMSFLSITSGLLIYFYRKTLKNNKVLVKLSNENKFLLSEANHRINNNLQLIIILILDQLKKQPEDKKEEIKKLLAKVDSIATLHKHLYQSKDKKRINCYTYLNDIKVNFFELFKAHGIEVEFHVDKTVEVLTDDIMYYGLLLTELFINSIKHAFKNQDDKQILFKLTLENNFIIFHYRDNGINEHKNPLQLKLIEKLSRQINIDYIVNTDNGFSFEFVKSFS